MCSFVRKIQGQIDKLRVPPLVSPLRIPVLLSDSKGFNLQKQAKVNPETYIKFWCDAGVTVENRHTFLKENLERELQKINYITLYVWVGTCNLTTKEDNYIYLTAKDHTAVDDIKKGLREIYSFAREFGN
jgi:hypothetical protein